MKKISFKSLEDQIMFSARQELKTKQTEMTNTITEMKTTLEGINSRITEAEERISDLEDKMKSQRAMYQMKKQDKTPEKQLNEVEIGNLPGKEFRRVIVKMIQDLGKRMEAKIEKMKKM